MSPGKLIVKTANVSISITTTAMLQSHQSLCSSFWSFSCSSDRSAPEEGFGWSMGDVDGGRFMAGRESRSKSEIRYTIINPMERGDGRKCARRTGMATAPWYSPPFSLYNHCRDARVAQALVDFERAGSPAFGFEGWGLTAAKSTRSKGADAAIGSKVQNRSTPQQPATTYLASTDNLACGNANIQLSKNLRHSHGLRSGSLYKSEKR